MLMSIHVYMSFCAIEKRAEPPQPPKQSAVLGDGPASECFPQLCLTKKHTRFSNIAREEEEKHSESKI